MQDWLSVVIIVGIVVTFLPQQVRIVRKRSSLGISPYFVLLGITSVLAQLINILILQIPVLKGCRSGSETCLSDLLGAIQVGVLGLSWMVNFILFLVYYPRPWRGTSEGEQVIGCIRLSFYFLLFCAILVVPTFLFAGFESRWTRLVGQFFGLVCTVLSCIQYVPQLVRTWITQRVGALSVLTLAIQAPGSFFFAYTLATRPSTDISTWGSFFISGCFQVMLVILCLWIGKDEEIETYMEGVLFVNEIADEEETERLLSA